jgi:hypothetical protein
MGVGEFGQLGLAKLASEKHLRKIPNFYGVSEIATGGYHSLALLNAAKLDISTTKTKKHHDLPDRFERPSARSLLQDPPTAGTKASTVGPSNSLTLTSSGGIQDIRRSISRARKGSEEKEKSRTKDSSRSRSRGKGKEREVENPGKNSPFRNSLSMEASPRDGKVCFNHDMKLTFEGLKFQCAVSCFNFTTS